MPELVQCVSESLSGRYFREFQVGKGSFLQGRIFRYRLSEVADYSIGVTLTCCSNSGTVVGNSEVAIFLSSIFERCLGVLIVFVEQLCQTFVKQVGSFVARRRQ